MTDFWFLAALSIYGVVVSYHCGKNGGYYNGWDESNLRLRDLVERETHTAVLKYIKEKRDIDTNKDEEAKN